MEEGVIWNGEEPPKVDDPLYVSIINQIKEQSGLTAKEPVAVGSPWEIRIPTSLIKLKKDSELPKWEERPEGSWDWESTDIGE